MPEKNHLGGKNQEQNHHGKLITQPQNLIIKQPKRAKCNKCVDILQPSWYQQTDTRIGSQSLQVVDRLIASSLQKLLVHTQACYKLFLLGKIANLQQV